MTTRRTFCTTSSLAALGVLGRPSASFVPLFRGAASQPSRVSRGPMGTLPHATDPPLKALALRALDAAKAAGASYADVRFTVTRRRTFNNTVVPTESETLAVGVQALAKGAWGFAAHSDWTPDGMAQLGRQAAEQAQVDAWTRVPPIELVDHSPVAVGQWVTPIKRDPFTVPVEETAQWIQQLLQAVHVKRVGLIFVLTFERQERTFVSSAGAYTTQTVYTSLGGVPHQNILPSMIVLAAPDSQAQKVGSYALPFVTPTGAGYEVLDDANVLAHLPEWIEKARALAPAKPFDALGEYDVVFDGAAMAAIVDGTFGAALEYDRAVGYEADAGGTSYLAPPLQILGTPRAPTTVTITGDRTLARGAATVQWDAEGIPTQPFPLVKEGVVVDYASSREFVKELAPWYQRRGVPVRSNGCAAAESAFTVPLVYPPNLVLSPAAQDTSLDALVAGVDNGFLVCGGAVEMDVQQMSGRGQGEQVYTIKHGKLTKPVKAAAYLFEGKELWKNLAALGGASTAMLRGLPSSKGQPNQGTVHSVQAVAAHVQKVRVDNASRT